MLKRLATILLLVNGLGALFGGWMLISDPTGGALQLPFELIEHTFLKTYFIPGLILFTLIGLLSLVAFLTIVMSFQRAYLFVLAEGLMLMVWISMQIILIRETHPLQFVYMGVAVLLLTAGWRMSRRHT
jgi:hypothetical protein